MEKRYEEVVQVLMDRYFNISDMGKLQDQLRIPKDQKTTISQVLRQIELSAPKLGANDQIKISWFFAMLQQEKSVVNKMLESKGRWKSVKGVVSWKKFYATAKEVEVK